MIAIIVCLSCLLFTVACNSSKEATNNEGNIANTQDDNKTENSTNNKDNINLPSHVQPVPPLQMESIDEVVSVLKSSDAQNYREEFQAKYSELFSVLKSSGFIYNVVTTDDVDIEDAITFLVINEKNMFFVMPYAQYEDVGIVSYITFRGAVYNVCVYNADAEVLSQVETISEYVEARLSRDVLNEVAVEENTICFMTDGDATVNQRNYAASFIDGDHYYFVSAEVTQDDLKTFLDVLDFEKIFVK